MINNNLGSLFKGNLGRTYQGRQFVFYKNKPTIFKTYIEIDNNQAKRLNLSYFKTATIYKKNNSYLNSNDKRFLINENQIFDIKNYLSGNYVNEKYNLLDKSNNFLGRSLKISESFSKNQIENYTIRDVKNYFFGVNMYIDTKLGFTINNLQEIFFETNFNVQSSIGGNEEYNTILIVYAFDKNDNIIDIKKIENFIPKNVTWFEDKTTTTLNNFDTIDFDTLLNFSFDNNIYNNIIRKMIISRTSIYNSLLNSDLNPIENITIQENNNDIENQNIQLINDNTDVFFNSNLQNLQIGEEIKYKIYLKITGSNKFYILNTSHKIINTENVGLVSNQNNLNQYLNIDATHLHVQNLIQIKLSMTNEVLNIPTFNPTFSGIYLNNIIDSQNLINNILLIATGNNSNNFISFNGELLKNILINSSRNVSDNIELIFYLKSNYNIINKIYFTFEENFKKYNISADITDVFEDIKLNQSLSIQNITKNTINYSNLYINYNIKISDYKNSNTNLNKLLFLNYDSIYIDQLKQNANAYKETFNNNIFVIIRKKIKQSLNNNNKERYYIFNKDIIDNLNLNLNIEYTDDISLDLKYNDDEELNKIFDIKDNIDENSITNYEISAKIMIIPLDFFSTTVNKFQIKEKIKEIILLNSQSKLIPSMNDIENIYNILFNINKDVFQSLKQLDLYKLFNSFCIKDSFAINTISLPKIITTVVDKSNLVLEYSSFSFNLDDFNLDNSKKESQILFTANFNLNSNLDNLKNVLNYLGNIVTDFFESFYYKRNNQYIDIFSLQNIGFTKREIIEKINNSFIKKYKFSNTTIDIEFSLILKNEIATFFRDLISLSINDKKNKNFLKNNFYIKLNFQRFSINKIDISIKNVDDIFVKFPLY